MDSPPCLRRRFRLIRRPASRSRRAGSEDSQRDRSTRPAAAISVLASCVAALLIAAGAQGAPIACDVGALKTAITAANSNPDATTIELAAGCAYTLTTADNTDPTFGSSGLPTITSPIIVDGNGATIARSGAAPAFRILYVTPSGELTLSDITLSNGLATGDGGAAILDRGVLHLSRSTISGNSATVGRGGGVWVDGLLASPVADIRDSTFTGNGAVTGGAIDVQGGSPSVTLENLTVVSNTASNAGGGLTVVAGTTTLTHSTVARNSLHNVLEASGAVLAVRNSIIESASSGSNCGGAISDGGHNISFPASDTSCPAGFSSGDPKLQPLANNGGPAQTMALVLGSAAISAVPSSGANCAAADQRGTARPQGPACDSGAFELEALPPTCQDASASGPFDTPIDVPLSCSDPQGYPLTLSAVATPSHGTLGPFGATSVTYTPNPGFSGADSFTFQATNGSASDTATASLAVRAGPPPPPGAAPPPPPAAPRLCFGRRATITATAGVVARGTPAADVIVGTRGPDRVVSGRGHDLVCSRGGDDQLSTGKGDDRVSAGPGADRVATGAGADQINPGSGPDRIDAGRGNDRLGLSGNARDTAICGPGRDRATADRSDRLRGCERVTRVGSGAR
jgi:Bacterial Ig domain/RTX calcium-binding nonapeptide repeat (4 copies)